MLFRWSWFLAILVIWRDLRRDRSPSFPVISIRESCSSCTVHFTCLFFFQRSWQQCVTQAANAATASIPLTPFARGSYVFRASPSSLRVHVATALALALSDNRTCLGSYARGLIFFVGRHLSMVS